MKIAIDLDDTILEMDWSKWIKYGMDYWGEPKPGAVDSIKELRQGGHSIVIHTCRVTESVTHSPVTWSRKLIMSALSKHGIEYDEIWIGKGKPLADYYVDDRAIEFTDWESTMGRLKEEEDAIRG